MTSRKSGLRRPAMAGLLFLLAPILVSCGGQVGSAAIVGNFAISTASIEGQTEIVGGSTGDILVTELGKVGIRVQTDRELLTYEIWHELLTQSGTSTQLSNDQINQIIAGYQGSSPIGVALGATPDTLNDRINDTSTLHQLVSDTVAAGTPISGPQVDVEYLSTPTLSEALAARTSYLADPAAMTAAVDAAIATDRGGRVTAAVLGNSVDLIPSGLFSAAPGQIVVAADGANQSLVVRVTGRSTNPTVLDAASIGKLSTAEINAIGAIILGQRATELPAVQVNPRFGVWDPELLQVVAAPSQL